MSTGTNENSIKTVLELDLASYTDIARALEENLDVYAVKAFEDQVQSFVDFGLNQVGLTRDNVVLGSAGDNAILVFDDSATMHRFAEAVQQAVAIHNRQKTVDSAKRWFRMGAATGPVLLIRAERRIVGTTVSRAVRMEAAAKNGQILVDIATYDGLPHDLKGYYGEEEVISGKRGERFLARRCTLSPTQGRSEADTEQLSIPNLCSQPDNLTIGSGGLSHRSAEVALDDTGEAKEVCKGIRSFVEIASGPFEGTLYELLKDRVLIGRSQDCDIHVDLPVVSRYHAQFVRTDSGYSFDSTDCVSRLV